MKRNGLKGVCCVCLSLLVLLSATACQKREEEPETAAAETVTEPVEEEPEAEPEIEPVEMDLYVEDENEYGNSIGNILCSGLFIFDARGLFYFHNNYEGQLFMTDAESGLSVSMLESGIIDINYRNEKLYGEQEDGSILVVDLNDTTTEVLRDGSAEYLQVVNDTMYYKDNLDNTLRCMPAEGGEETILVDEPIWYPVVYKDQVFFQLDSDNESLYAVPITGGELTKINDMATYKSIIYHDVIYYQGKADGVVSLYRMNLDGSGITLLDEENPAVMNIYGDTLYYVTQETPNEIRCLDLSSENSAWERMDLTEQLAAALDEAYGDVIDKVTIDQYGFLNFYGNYMLFLCDETIDGNSYADEYIYNMETDEIIVIPVFCQMLDSLLEQAGDSGGAGTGSSGNTGTTEESGTTEQTPSRSYPAGTYSPGSIYGPKLSQTQLDQVADAVTAFLQTYDTASMDDYTKVLTAHDYLCNTCSYAPDWSQNGANTAWGALVYHEAQCSGYARAMKALCDAMGVGCYYVHADGNASNPSHQWNEVCVNGNWYIVDVQCNDSSGYKAFFLVSDDTYAGASGMSWDRSSVPACPANY